MSMFHRYSDDTIEAVETLDGDEKIDLELIASLIRQIVLNEGVSLMWRIWSQGSSLWGKYITIGFQSSHSAPQTRPGTFNNEWFCQMKQHLRDAMTENLADEMVPR